MPSTSKKQAKFMAACAHGADYDSCPPKKVAKEFNDADKRKAFKEWVELEESPLNAWQNRMKRKGAIKFTKKDGVKHLATDDEIHAYDEKGNHIGTFSQSKRQGINEELLTEMKPKILKPLNHEKIYKELTSAVKKRHRDSGINIGETDAWNEGDHHCITHEHNGGSYHTLKETVQDHPNCEVISAKHHEGIYDWHANVYHKPYSIVKFKTHI